MSYGARGEMQTAVCLNFFVRAYTLVKPLRWLLLRGTEWAEVQAVQDR